MENFVGLMPKYLNSLIFRIWPGIALQCGDFVNNNGSGGYSIYGCSFDDEKPLLRLLSSFVGCVVKVLGVLF